MSEDNFRHSMIHGTPFQGRHTHQRAGLTRSAWFDEVLPILMRFMLSAKEAEILTDIAQMALVDPADRITSSFWESVVFRSVEEKTGAPHWSIAPRNPGSTGIGGDVYSTSVLYSTSTRGVRLRLIRLPE